MKRYKTGFVLGKFCPLHKGHMFLIDTALSHVEQLYIVVDNIMDEVARHALIFFCCCKCHFVPPCFFFANAHILPQNRVIAIK